MIHPVVFGQYLLLERISVGGMAEVFIAQSLAGGERVLAIKRILPTVAEDEDLIAMFIDEARISVQLHHSNIAQVYELGKHRHFHYIALEYVAGKDLRSVLEQFRQRKQRMPVDQAVFIASKICEGLDYAHRRLDFRGNPLNIVHRDVSPRNVLVSYDGEIKIIDFGIAKAAYRARQTEAGVLVGKLGYMSPEQALGLPVDRRADIFALGVILYEMLTGEKLFHGETDRSTLELIKTAAVPSPTRFNPLISPQLEATVLKALARDPEQRYRWAGDLAEDLMRILFSGETVYSSQRLAAFMRSRFAEDLALEARRMERFAQAKPPAEEELPTLDGLSDTSPRRQTSDWDIATIPSRSPGDLPPTLSMTGRNPPSDETVIAGREQTSRLRPNLQRSAAPALTAGQGSWERTERLPSGAAISATPVMARPGPGKPQSLGELAPHRPSVDRQARRNARLTAYAFAAGIAVVGAFVLSRALAPRFGKIAVFVDVDPPSAAISINGVPTPNGALIFLSAGEHRVLISAPHYEAIRRTLVVPRGETGTVLKERLEPSTAELRAAGRPSAQAPLGTPTEAEVPVKAVAAAEIAEPSSRVFSVKFDTIEPDVEISVDGRVIGKTPNALGSGLAVGIAHQYAATKAGFRRHQGEFHSDSSDEIQVAFQLAREPLPATRRNVPSRLKGRLACSSLPAGAQVWVDGRYSGRTTPVPIGNPLVLPAGQHAIVFKMADGTKQSTSQPVQIRENEITKLVNVLLN